MKEYQDPFIDDFDIDMTDCVYGADYEQYELMDEYTLLEDYNV